MIDGMNWHGNVEIHQREADWNSHGHQNDSVYNSVVLHVVLERSNCRVKRADGTEPYTLELKQFLSRPLSELVQFKNSQGDIACKGNSLFMNQAAFEAQIRRVTSEYFEYKAEELLLECKMEKRLSVESWRNGLIIQIYSALGIPANCDQMKELSRRMIVSVPDSGKVGVDKYIEHALKLAFSESDRSERIDWVKSGMRPASRPKKRIIQAAAIQYAIMSVPVQTFFEEPQKSWKIIQGLINSKCRAGAGRTNMIKNTVYLPALYLLGSCLDSDFLMNRSYEVWLIGAHMIPDEVLKPFKDAGFMIKGEAKSLGLVHQLKRYCNHQRCFECELFKNAIRS